MKLTDELKLSKDALTILLDLTSFDDPFVSYKEFIQYIPEQDLEYVEKGLEELVTKGIIEFKVDIVCPRCEDVLGPYTLKEIKKKKSFKCPTCGKIIKKDSDEFKQFIDIVIYPTEKGRIFFRKYKDRERETLIKRRFEAIISPIFGRC